MNKLVERRTLASVGITLAVFCLVILLLSAVNLSGESLVAEDNGFAAREMQEEIYALKGVRSGDDMKSFTVETEGTSVALMINNLAFPYEIYINGRLESQNADPSAAGFNNAYIYKVFDLEPEEENKITVTGTGAAGTLMYLAPTAAMERGLAVRTTVDALLFFLLVFITAGSVAWGLWNRNLRFFWIFALIGGVSVLRALVMGEPAFLAALLELPIQDFSFLNTLTACANAVLPIWIILKLLEIKVPLKKMAVLIAGFAALSAAVVLTRSPQLYLVLQTAVYLLSFGLAVAGVSYRKSYAKIILVNNPVYASLVVYGQLVILGIFENGPVNFYVHSAYLGAVLYLCVFFGVFMLALFRRMKEMEKKKTDYERAMLLRGISHDFKLPLSVLKINNQMLSKCEMNEDERKACARLSGEAVGVLEKMTDNINGFLNLESGFEKRARVDLRACFDKVTAQYALLAKEKNISFSAVWQAGEVFLHADSLQMERMFYNFLDNALKYNRENGKVTISCLREKEKLRIRIEDNGEGMNAEKSGRIFEPFYRGDKNRTTEGLGLGLSVAAGVVRGMGGEIEVFSKEGEGTTFVICLPVR